MAFDLVVSEKENVSFDRAYCKRYGLAGFVRLAWHIIEPTTPYVRGWHADVIAERTQEIIEGKITRGVINVPPGTGKSSSISQCAHPYAWGPGGRPGMKFIFASYDAGLATRDATRAKRIITSEWFQSRWPEVELVGGNRAAEGMQENTAGGFRFSTSVKGDMTGRHADMLIVDDPHKPVDLLGKSPANLTLVKSWWEGTVASRFADPITGRRLVVMQRLHEEDLSGICLGAGYDHLCLPMRFEPERATRGDRRTQAGELLFPERFPESVVKGLETDMGDEARAQLQQDPFAKGGGILKQEWFRYWQELPERIDRLFWSWDCTFKDAEGSDYVAGGLWMKSGADYYFLHRVLEKMDFSSTARAVRDMASWSKNLWGRGGEVLVEDKANGPAVINVLKSSVPGLVAINPLGGKVARANAVSYLFRGGNVFFPHPDLPGMGWVRDHVKTCARFPRVKHDDTVDQMTQALLWGEQADGNMSAALKAWQERNKNR